jgi:hypothetical protein
LVTRLITLGVFLSCVLGASDKTPDKQYLTEKKPGENWSKLKFPKERPPKKDFLLLEVALRQVVPAGGIQDRLGRLRHLDYKVWDWRWDMDGQRLLHLKGENMDVYVASNLPRMEGVANRWTRARMDREAENIGRVCTVREVELAVAAIVSNTAML